MNGVFSRSLVVGVFMEQAFQLASAFRHNQKAAIVLPEVLSTLGTAFKRFSEFFDQGLVKGSGELQVFRGRPAVDEFHGFSPAHKKAPFPITERGRSEGMLVLIRAVGLTPEELRDLIAGLLQGSGR